ncbi:MAG: hypothetical protein WC732_03745 [Candidatus Omnitrophota bacterium]
MDNISFEIKNQLYLTVVQLVDFFKGANLLYAGIVVLALYVLFLRNWTFPRIFSFSLTFILLFVLFVRLDHLLLTKLSQDAAYYGVGVFRILSIVVAAAILLYYSVIKP